MENSEIRKQIERWYGDRLEIGLRAIDDAGEKLFIFDADGIVAGIASIDNGELLNLATRESGYGVAVLLKVAQWARENHTMVRGMTTDQSAGFYILAGWTVEGYAGENSGITMYWDEHEMAGFVASPEAMREKMREILEEWENISYGG